MRVSGFPTTAPGAEPLPAVCVENPEDTLIVLQQQLGYLDAERRLVQFTVVIVHLELSKPELGLLKSRHSL
jgi:hypothetical protein